MVTEKQFESAKRKYNQIMMTIGYEHVTIGTDWSESTENWNLRDMVAEADYWLSTYYENGHCNYDLRFEDRKMWVAQTGYLKRFILHWLPYVEDIQCAEGHCSQYDHFYKGQHWEEIKPKYSLRQEEYD